MTGEGAAKSQGVGVAAGNRNGDAVKVGVGFDTKSMVPLGP